AFSEVIRKEVCASNVRVTTIYPGMVNTEFFDGITDPRKKQTFDKLKETMDPLLAEDIAEVILFTLTRPGRVSLNEIVVRPTRQPISPPPAARPGRDPSSMLMAHEQAS